MEQVIINNPVTVHPDDHLEKVNDLINKRGYCHLPVMKDNILIGIINSSDLTGRYLANMREDGMISKPISEFKVSDLMNTDPIFAYDTDDLDRITEKFLQNDIKGLPIIDKHRNLKGLITSFDLLDYLLAA